MLPPVTSLSMFKVFLLAAAVLAAQEKSMDCSHVAATQTPAARGPVG